MSEGQMKMNGRTVTLEQVGPQRAEGDRLLWDVINEAETLTRDMRLNLRRGDLETARSLADQYNALRQDYKQAFDIYSEYAYQAGRMDEMSSFDPMIAPRGRGQARGGPAGAGLDAQWEGFWDEMNQANMQKIMMVSNGIDPDLFNKVRMGEVPYPADLTTVEGFTTRAKLLPKAAKGSAIDEAVMQPFRSELRKSLRDFGESDLGALASQLQAAESFKGDQRNQALLDAASDVASRYELTQASTLLDQFDPRKVRTQFTIKDPFDQSVRNLRASEVDAIMRGTNAEEQLQLRQQFGQQLSSIKDAGERSRVRDYFNTRFGLTPETGLQQNVPSKNLTTEQVDQMAERTRPSRFYEPFTEQEREWNLMVGSDPGHLMRRGTAAPGTTNRDILKQSRDFWTQQVNDLRTARAQTATNSVEWAARDQLLRQATLKAREAILKWQTDSNVSVLSNEHRRIIDGTNAETGADLARGNEGQPGTAAAPTVERSVTSEGVTVRWVVTPAGKARVTAGPPAILGQEYDLGAGGRPDIDAKAWAQAKKQAAGGK